MAITLNRRGLVATRTALFRVDAGPGIGLGHFMRCRTLAFELIRRNWVVFFIGHGLPSELLKTAATGVNAVINLIGCEKFADSSADAEALMNILEQTFGWHVDCLIIDTYRYGRDDFAFLQRFNVGQVPVVVIDDIADRDTPAQAVINPNPLFAPLPYERQKIPVILCGEKYTLIRPEITAQLGRPYCKEGPIVVTLGGGDVVEPMMRVLQALPEDLPNQVCVSVSENCPREAIEEWINRRPGLRFLNIDNLKFPELLAASALAITAGGTTLWEAYCLGIPSLALLWVDNQRQTSVVIKEQATSFLIDIVSAINIELKSKWLESGLQTVVETVGIPDRTRGIQQQGFRADEVISRERTSIGVSRSELIEPDFIRKILGRLNDEPEFWAQMIERQQRLIDGRGVIRCVEAVENLVWHPVPLFDSDWRRKYEDW